jgi:H+/Cl- antiporter ClcA
MRIVRGGMAFEPARPDGEVSMTHDPPAVEPAKGAAAPPDPQEMLRSRGYIALLLLGALAGVPIATVAYLFLVLVNKSQTWIFTDLPEGLGFTAEPTWWPVVPLTVCGLLVGLSLTYLPGTGGHPPAEGFHAGGATDPRDLPGVFAASLVTLCFGAVLGPEAPLIAIGSGLGVLAVHLVKKDAPRQASLVIGGAGSFAAISTLLGSPLVGAFLLMEAAGIAGPILGVVLLPGLLAAGIGALIFVGLDQWSGQGTFSLAIPGIEPFGVPTVAEFGYAALIGVLAAVAGVGIQRFARALQPVVARRRLLLSPVVGFGVGVLAALFAGLTDKSSSWVLFSGQDALPDLVEEASSWSVGALVLLLALKGLAYGLSLSSFRGGPVFPAVFLGAAGGLAMSHLPGLPMIAGVGIGVGAMAVAMLRLPMVSALLPALLLASDAAPLMPLIIVGVVVAHVVTARLTPRATATSATATSATAPATGAPHEPDGGRADTGTAGATPSHRRATDVR